MYGIVGQSRSSFSSMDTVIRPPSITDALIPIISLIILLAGAIYLYGDGATSGPTQVALLLATMIAGLIGLKNGFRWEDMGHAAVEGISTALGAIFILLAVGALVGTWMMSGTITTLVHLGVQFLSASWYYVACVIICALLALSIGSSWTVVGTIGIGLIAIAEALGVSPEITAGAIISGGMVSVPDFVTPATVTIGKILSVLLPKLALVHLEPEHISRDPEVVAAYINDPLVFIGKSTARIGAELLKAMQRVTDEATLRGAFCLCSTSHINGQLYTAR